MEQVLAVLQEALRLEAEGEAFYREASHTCNNPIAEKTFAYLAEQEARHAQYFKLYYDILAEQKAWPPAGSMDLATVKLPEAAEGIFAAAREALDPDAQYCVDLTATYEQAMEKERASLALYEGQLEGAEPEARAFFEFLIEQEQEHLEMLANTQKYLDDPAHWFFDQEQWIVEG